MKEKIAADIAVIVPAVSITWFDMFDGGLKLAVGIITLAAVLKGNLGDNWAWAKQLAAMKNLSVCLYSLVQHRPQKH
jgi:hypothetical protein